MGILSFFKNMFYANKRHRWENTPEQFLAMVLFLQNKNTGHYSAKEVLQWGEIMQKVMNVRLHPYKSFADLLERGNPDSSLVDMVETKLSEMQSRIALKKAIYGENVDLGDDNILQSNSKDAVETRMIMEELSKYIKFRDDQGEP